MEKPKNQIVIYQTKSGALELRGDYKSKTIWATQADMAQIFNVNSQAITKHIQNIYAEGELIRLATCSNLEQVRIEGNRTVKRTVDVYNLDIIISVGYRINSVVGTKFRQWATKTLKQYIVEGYAVNKSRIAKNYQQFLKTVEDIKLLLPSNELVNTGDVVELISLYADTWVSLEAYDKGEFKAKRVTKRGVDFTAQKLEKELANLKLELLTKGLATQLFGAEQTLGRLTGIVGNVMQSFDGKDLYPSIEEKSAHLLYFIVKDHPFMDGNKRSAAFAFVWLLKQASILNTNKLTPSALTALTILIAESNSKDKEKVIKLITALQS